MTWTDEDEAAAFEMARTVLLGTDTHRECAEGDYVRDCDVGVAIVRAVRAAVEAERERHAAALAGRDYEIRHLRAMVANLEGCGPGPRCICGCVATDHECHQGDRGACESCECRGYEP